MDSNKSISFPLYDELLLKALESKVIIDGKAEARISALVNKLDSKDQVILMALIIHHAVSKGIYKEGIFPYNGKVYTNNNGVKYKVEDFPEEFKKILWFFLGADKIN